MSRSGMADWLPWVAAALPFAAAGAWSFWDLHIGPGLISRVEIERAAEEIMAGCVDPADEAFQREWRAWSRCEGFEQGRWRRVRHVIRRRQKAERRGRLPGGSTAVAPANDPASPGTERIEREEVVPLR